MILVFGAAAPVAWAGSYSISASDQALCELGKFATNVAPTAAYAFAGDCPGPAYEVQLVGPDAESSSGDREVFEVDSPSPDLTIAFADAANTNGTFPDGYSGGTYWESGGQAWADVDSRGDVNGSYWGIQLLCSDTNYCEAPSGALPSLSIGSLDLTISETASPVLSEGGLWGQTGWVWNTPSDPWNVTLSGTDASGVCSEGVSVNGAQPQTELFAQDSAVWMQCASPAVEDVPVDTTQYPSAAGSISLSATARNAAGNVTTVPSGPSTSVNVDNVAPSITIAPQSSSDPAGSGDVAVTPSVGPSGISSLGCTVDGQEVPLPASPNSAGAYLFDVGDSTSHTVVCSVANGAVNPQGQHNTATAAYVVKAADSSAVSFEKIHDPLIKQKVKERVLVAGGHHYVFRLIHGKRTRVRVSGHYVTRTVVRYVEHCTTKRVVVKVKGRPRTKRERSCVKPTSDYQNTILIAHGQSTTVYGELASAQGVALAGQSVSISSTPSSGGTLTQIGTAMTNAQGGWSARVPAGPSRTITATYAGSSTQLPSSASATVSVPAKVDLSISPRRIPWGRPVRITGGLVGGYVPAHGVAMRLLIRIPGLAKPYVATSFRTTAKGSFSFRFVAPQVFSTPKVMAIAIAMDGNESDYPFDDAQSPYLPVQFGVRTAAPKG